MSKETEVVTGKVRFSYCHVWEPSSIKEGAKKKYSTSILIDKTDKKTIAAIEAAVAAAMEEGKSKWGGKIPKGLKLPLRDGDAEKDDETYQGKLFLNASSSRQPGIVDKLRKPIMDTDEFYSGCYGRADLNFYAYDVDGGKGIAVGLNNIMKTADGESLAGGRSAEEAFSAIEDEDDDEGLF